MRVVVLVLSDCEVSRTTRDSTAAALKAIQCLSKGCEAMVDKIGVFICTGYGIADALDIDALISDGRTA